MFWKLFLYDTKQWFYVDIWANNAPEAIKLYYCLFPGCLQYKQQFSQNLYIDMEIHYVVQKYIKYIWRFLKWAKIQMGVQKFVNGNLKCVFLCISPLMQASQGVELKAVLVSACLWRVFSDMQSISSHWNQLLIYTWGLLSPAFSHRHSAALEVLL